MPSTYAHRRFGEEMIGLYPLEIKEIAEKYRSLYDMGLHGPDLLFYHKPLSSNAVCKSGYAIHAQSGAFIFEHAANILDGNGWREDSLAYILGFICHYALDSTCHGYIEKKLLVTDLYHAEIETEFDKFLMREEGKDPFRYQLLSHIKADKDNAKIIAPFFDGEGEVLTRVTPDNIEEAMKGMLFYGNMLRGDRTVKRILVNTLLKMARIYPEYHGMMFAKKDIEECRDSNLRLKKLFEAAKMKCLSLTEKFMERKEGEALGELFAPTFGPCKDWMSILVLPYEEEVNYEVEA